MIKIICNKSQTALPASKQVIRVGKYLVKFLDGVIKYKISSNMFDIYTTLLYADPKTPDTQEMVLNLNLTTYQNKLRVDVIEITPEERTLGFDLFPLTQLDDLKTLSTKIYNKVLKRVEKAYRYFEFLI